MLRYNENLKCYDLVLEDGDIKLDETVISGIILDLIINKRDAGVWGYWANDDIGSHLWVPEANVDLPAVRRAVIDALRKWDEISDLSVEKTDNGWKINMQLIGEEDFSLEITNGP